MNHTNKKGAIMLVKIINVASFSGQFINTMKINFASVANQEEGGIELSGYITKAYPYLLHLKNDDIIDLSIEIEVKSKE